MDWAKTTTRRDQKRLGFDAAYIRGLMVLTLRIGGHWCPHALDIGLLPIRCQAITGTICRLFVRYQRANFLWKLNQEMKNFIMKIHMKMWSANWHYFVEAFWCETGIYQQNYVNTMAGAAQAPCVARTSAVMVLTMQDKQVFIIHEQVFQLPEPMSTEKW